MLSVPHCHATLAGTSCGGMTVGTIKSARPSISVGSNLWALGQVRPGSGPRVQGGCLFVCWVVVGVKINGSVQIELEVMEGFAFADPITCRDTYVHYYR